MKTNTHRFTDQEIENMKNRTEIDSTEKLLRKWAGHQYPLGTGVYSIRKIDVDQAVVKIDER